MAPASKIVWLTDGMKVQVADEALNRVDSARLIRPPEPGERDLRERNWPCAAPMLALAAAQLTSSACSTSGRSSSTVELTAVGSRSSTTTSPAAIGRQIGVGHRRAHHQVERVAVLGDLGGQAGDVEPGLLDDGLRLG